MALADRLRKYAQECLDQAKAATDDELKGALLHNAEGWLRLAIAYETRHASPARGGAHDAASRLAGPTPAQVMRAGRERLRHSLRVVPASARVGPSAIPLESRNANPTGPAA